MNLQVTDNYRITRADPHNLQIERSEGSAKWKRVSYHSNLKDALTRLLAILTEATEDGETVTVNKLLNKIETARADIIAAVESTK